MTFSSVLTLILVGGVLAVLAATLADYLSHRRVETAMRGAAGLDRQPAERPSYVSPSYVSSEQLDVGALPAEKTTPEFEQQLAAQLNQGATLEVGLASDQFATHTGQRAILTDVAVLVCADEPSQLRELLPMLRLASTDPTVSPLVIAAPGFAENVLNTLAANRLAGTIQVFALVGSTANLQELAELAGAVTTDLPLRQSGAVTSSHLGHLALLVADLEQTSALAQKE